MSSDATPPSGPLDGLELDDATTVEKRQIAVLLLWAISRARMKHDSTTRYSEERAFLDDYLEPFADGHEAPDSATAWAAVRASDWWASDVPAHMPLGAAEFQKSNPAGGLSLHVLEEARDDTRCPEIIRPLIDLLPPGKALDDLLYGFALDQFVTHAEEPSPEGPERPAWPGVLDAELASGSHDLANAASVGDWDAVLEILDSAGAVSTGLVNSWRPGGVSMVTPLHQTAAKGAPRHVVESLVARGAWRTLADSRGWRPLELALLHGRSEMVDLLAPDIPDAENTALLSVLSYRLKQLLEDVTKEDAVPRFRSPDVHVLQEAGGELDFDLVGSGHFFRLFLEEGELLVEHTSAGDDESGVVYRIDGTGVVDTWENGVDDDELQASPAADPELPEASEPAVSEQEPQAEANDASAPVEEDVPQVVAEPSPPSGGIRTLWSELGTCALTVVPLELIRRFNREREHRAEVLVVAVSEFKKGRRWESITAVGASENIPDETVAGKRWSIAVVIECPSENPLQRQTLRHVLEREAESGLGPDSHEDLLVAMGNRHGRENGTWLTDRWSEIHELAVIAEVQPQRGNSTSGKAEAGLSTVVDARERRGIGSNLDAGTGGDKYFDPPIRMTLESPHFAARADWDGETIIVKSGSTARKATLESMPAEARAIRKDLLSRGVIREVAGRYVFRRDCRFKSVSSAASLITGRTAGGRVEWKDPQGRTINDILGGPKYRRGSGASVSTQEVATVQETSVVQPDAVRRTSVLNQPKVLPRVRVDREVTAWRTSQLDAYLSKFVDDGTRLTCLSASECIRTATAKPGVDFHSGQLSYVGPRYDLNVDGSELRVAVLGMEVGRPPEHITMVERARQQRAVMEQTPGSRSPHMTGTTSALRVMFGGRPGADRKGETLTDAETGETFHVMDAYSLLNLRLCSAVAKGSTTSRPSPEMTVNCGRHLRKSLEILEPSILILQSSKAMPALKPILTSSTRISDHLFEARIRDREFLVASFWHPYQHGIHGKSNWGRLPSTPYLDDVVVPTLVEARRRIIGK